MESDSDIHSQLKTVFQALDVENSGFIETDRFTELAREYFGSGIESNQVGLTCIALLHAAVQCIVFVIL